MTSLVVCIATLSVVVLSSRVAGAATDTVTNCYNSGAGSLRQTVANASAGDTINFALSPPCSTIDDPTGSISITKNLTITGPGPNVLTFSGDSASSLFSVGSGVAASISGLKIANAVASSGSAIYNSGTLTLFKDVLSANTAMFQGGAIYNDGTLDIADTTLSGNVASPNTMPSVATGSFGGAIYNSGTATISNSTLTNNIANVPGWATSAGGGIYNVGTLHVAQTTLSGNVATFGGGITTAGTATVSNSTLTSNNADESAGGIYNEGAPQSNSLTVSNTTFSGNSAARANCGGSCHGGGIRNDATMMVTNSTISDNSSANDGAGVFNGGTANISNSTLFRNNTLSTASSFVNGGGIENAGSMTVSNSTLSDNNASGYGGGIVNLGQAAILNSTVTHNSGGGGIGGAGIFAYDGTTNVSVTILASNVGGDCGRNSAVTTVSDNGYNIDDDGSCGFAGSSISNYSALHTTLGPLANNGGPTKTIALLPANPAIDYVPAADCPANDQRGFARTAPCDIGAYDTDTGASTGPCAGTATRCFTSGASDSTSVGSFFSFNVTTSGSPSPKIKEKGKLPKGVKFHKGTGTATLSGTPTSTMHKSAVGTYPLTFTATFGKGKTKQVVTQAFTLTVAP